VGNRGNCVIATTRPTPIPAHRARITLRAHAVYQLAAIAHHLIPTPHLEANRLYGPLKRVQSVNRDKPLDWHAGSMLVRTNIVGRWHTASVPNNHTGSMGIGPLTLSPLSADWQGEC
jgi:hypothetical protein